MDAGELVELRCTYGVTARWTSAGSSFKVRMTT
jgi:hypothetical protein